MADKGVIVEYDFTALDGAGILFDTAKRFLKDLDGIKLDRPTEIRHLAGKGFQDGLQSLFSAVKTKKTAAKAARDLEAAFNSEVGSHVAEGLTTGFRNFIKARTEKDVKVVIVTRADVGDEAVKAAFAPILGEKVVLHHETSAQYGFCKWESWRQAGRAIRLRNASCIAVTGSGFGVKSALLAGMGSLAVEGERVAYQDFGGADAIVARLDAAAARKALAILRIV